MILPTFLGGCGMMRLPGIFMKSNLDTIKSDEDILIWTLMNFHKFHKRLRFRHFLPEALSRVLNTSYAMKLSDVNRTQFEPKNKYNLYLELLLFFSRWLLKSNWILKGFFFLSFCDVIHGIPKNFIDGNSNIESFTEIIENALNDFRYESLSI